MIEGYLARRDVQRVRDLFDEMAEMNIEPDANLSDIKKDVMQ